MKYSKKDIEILEFIAEHGCVGVYCDECPIYGKCLNDHSVFIHKPNPAAKKILADLAIEKVLLDEV